MGPRGTLTLKTSAAVVPKALELRPEEWVHFPGETCQSLECSQGMCCGPNTRGKTSRLVTKGADLAHVSFWFWTGPLPAELSPFGCLSLSIATLQIWNVPESFVPGYVLFIGGNKIFKRWDLGAEVGGNHALEDMLSEGQHTTGPKQRKLKLLKLWATVNLSF